MVRIVKGLLDDAKKEILENADHKCQCNFGHFGHECTTIVNKNSYFITNIPPKSGYLDYNAVKVLCKPCIDKRHYLHLPFPRLPKPPFNLPR